MWVINILCFHAQCLLNDGFRMDVAVVILF